MHKYLATLRLGLLDAVEYRTEFFVSVLGWGIRLFIAVFLWLAVMDARGGEVAGYTFNHIMSYFFIVQIITSFSFSRLGFDIANDIYRGDFANFMLKPINYIVMRATHEISKNAFRMFLGSIIFGTILFTFFEGIPFTLWKIPLTIVALMGAYFINICLVCLIALSAFWIVSSKRLMFIYFGILTIFSGMILPMDLFPPRLFNFLQFLPFPYIFFFPAKIIQATTLNPTLIHGFFIQAGYIGLLGLLVWYMYHRGVRHFESVGR